MQPLVLLIFYGVSGGPFGVEPVVSAAGPFLALMGFLLLPMVWSIPEALVTAELSTTFPEAAGCVAWVRAARVGLRLTGVSLVCVCLPSPYWRAADVDVDLAVPLQKNHIVVSPFSHPKTSDPEEHTIQVMACVVHATH